MRAPDYADALRSLRQLAPSEITDTVLRLARRAGALEAVAYLVDFAETVLYPLPDRGMHVDAPVELPVVGTAAGAAFAGRRVVREDGPGQGATWWVPVLEGSMCTGVLGLSLPSDGDPDDRSLEEVGMLVGAILALAARQTDLFDLIRRRRAMTLPASMQWDLLPPLRLETPECSSTGLLEPAYEVGGDLFDHAVNGFSLHVAIMDAMGHGLESSLTSALAVGAYRHDRREGQPLTVMHERLDGVVADRFRGSFVTGQIGHLDLRSGELAWINAGHPAPLLVRGGRVLGPLRCRPSLPWGLGGALAEQAEHLLRPGDGVVFYSDGVVEGHSDEGVPFGLERLVGAIEGAQSVPVVPELVLRRAIADVTEHQGSRLRDDATLLWVQWDPRGHRA